MSKSPVARAWPCCSPPVGAALHPPRTWSGPSLDIPLPADVVGGDGGVPGGDRAAHRECCVCKYPCTGGRTSLSFAKERLCQPSTPTPWPYHASPPWTPPRPTALCSQ